MYVECIIRHEGPAEFSFARPRPLIGAVNATAGTAGDWSVCVCALTSTSGTRVSSRTSSGTLIAATLPVTPSRTFVFGIASEVRMRSPARSVRASCRGNFEDTSAPG